MSLNQAKQDLDRKVADLYARCAENKLLPDDLASSSAVERPSTRSWMREAYETRAIHQPDAIALGPFRREMGTILDIGAYWGYTALAVRLFGSDCPILSVEASEDNAEGLDEFRRRDGNYDFSITALGDEEGVRHLCVPVINNFAISGLNCIDGLAFCDSYKDQIVALVGSMVRVAPSYRVQLLKVPLPVRRLDNLLASERFKVPTDSIAAIKIDVDGSESRVLRGAIQTLKTHLPLVMIEEANRVPDVVEIFQSLGYHHYDLDGHRLRPTNGMSMAINGFWVHPDREAQYQAMGLI